MATTTLGNKAVGSIIQLKENGKLVSFYVAKHNYENEQRRISFSEIRLL